MAQQLNDPHYRNCLVCGTIFWVENLPPRGASTVYICSDKCAAAWESGNAPQTPKDAPRTYELSKEDIDLIESLCEGYVCDHETRNHRDLRKLLKTLGRDPNF